MFSMVPGCHSINVHLTPTFALADVKFSFVSSGKVPEAFIPCLRDYVVMCLTSTSQDIFDKACNYKPMEQARLVIQSGPAGYCRNMIIMCVE